MLCGGDCDAADDWSDAVLKADQLCQRWSGECSG